MCLAGWLQSPDFILEIGARIYALTAVVPLVRHEHIDDYLCAPNFVHLRIVQLAEGLDPPVEVENLVMVELPLFLKQLFFYQELLVLDGVLSNRLLEGLYVVVLFFHLFLVVDEHIRVVG